MTKSSIMANKTYAQWRQEKLTDPVRAMRYLRAASRESNEAFLHAVKNVVQANQVTKIAKEVGVARESIYRSFSEEGNPAYLTVKAVLEAIGLTFDIKEKEEASGNVPPDPPRTSHQSREPHVRHGSPATVVNKVFTMPKLNASPNVISAEFGVGKSALFLNSLVPVNEAVDSSVFNDFQASATGEIVVIGYGNTGTLKAAQQQTSFLAPVECLLANQDEAKELVEKYGTRPQEVS
jgi:probable addiction module antidote protein